MNMPGFSSSYHTLWSDAQPWPAWWDQLALVVRDVLFDGKFNALFSFLFGVGFTIQLRRLEERAPNRAIGIYLRRLLALFAFGLAHGCLLWAGDVLHMYALLGLSLLVVRRWPNGAIATVIAVCLLYPGLINLALPSVTPAEAAAHSVLERTHAASNDVAFGTGSFLEAAVESSREMLLTYTGPYAAYNTPNFYLMLLATMLLGLLVGRHRWIQDAARHATLLSKLQRGGLILGLICGIAFTALIDLTAPMERSPLRIASGLSYSFARVGLLTFYVTTLVRLSLQPHWAQRLAPLAAAGRMPLSNYLLQSVIGTGLFYGWGLGLWGKIGWALQMALAAAVFFFVQIPFSRWWLRRHAYGPMEYLWRVLTYGPKQPAVSA
jgi:uncharacterized protein